MNKALIPLLSIVLSGQLGAAQYGRALINQQAQWVKLEAGKYYQLADAPFTTEQVLAELTTAPKQWLPPLSSGQVLAVGLNYRSHAGEAGAAKPEVFFKSADAVQLSGALALPAERSNLHFEGELVVVIGQACYQLNPEQAKGCAFGYLVGNDFTERSWQARDLQWWRAKGAKGFGPVSHFINSDFEPAEQLLTTRLNGQVVQQESIANMIHSVPEIISHISQHIALKPGDMIFTGTPGRTRSLKAGDSVEVSVEGLASVKTEIVEAN